MGAERCVGRGLGLVQADMGFVPLPFDIEQRHQRDRRLHRRGGKTADMVEVGIGRRVDCIETVEDGKPVLRPYHAKDIDRQIRLHLYPAIHTASPHEKNASACCHSRQAQLPGSETGTFALRNRYPTTFWQPRPPAPTDIPAPTEMEADHAQDRS
ncbi:hypothetical protein MES5069_250021 [Mesorhizobium escarrei]|uniref:Uncharacterized protein n=1 Tax=Mesorhizobium escarrei TaxID=666018 RepID=A0ABM9DU24_9HYPH|nr:hypothetical protein MES5069_250021 [Mesorhizobium escarrei]